MRARFGTVWDCSPPFTALVLEEDGSGRVERIATGSSEVVRKSYFARPFLLWRTFGQRSRARREHDNLTALLARGVPCVRPVAWTERRALGCVPSCSLMTEFVSDGCDLRRVLTVAGDAGQRRLLATRFGRLVRRVHRAGYVSTTLSPRNVIVSSTALLLCDQPSAVAFGDDATAHWYATVDLFDALFSIQRRREWSRTERFRGVLAYSEGDRVAAARIWRRLSGRPRAWNRVLKGCVRLLGRVRLGTRYTRPEA